MKVRSVTLYYQTDADTGGSPGWAYNVISAGGEHTSDGFVVSNGDDGRECLSDVCEAFCNSWPEVCNQVVKWTPNPEGGWRGTTKESR